MNQAENRAEAERLVAQGIALIGQAQRHINQARSCRDDAHLYLRAAQVHATLAAIEEDDEQDVSGETTRDKTRQAAPFVVDGRPKPHPPTQRERL